MKKILLLFLALTLLTSASSPRKYYLSTISFYDYSPNTPNNGCHIWSRDIGNIWQVLHNYTCIEDGGSTHRIRLYYRIYTANGTVVNAWWYKWEKPISPIYLN